MSSALTLRSCKNGLGSLVSQGAGIVTTVLTSIWSSSKTLIDIGVAVSSSRRSSLFTRC